MQAGVLTQVILQVLCKVSGIKLGHNHFRGFRGNRKRGLQLLEDSRRGPKINNRHTLQINLFVYCVRHMQHTSSDRTLI